MITPWMNPISTWSCVLHTAAALSLLLCTFSPVLAQGETYYVTPGPSDHQTLCPTAEFEDTPCMTLSEFASKPSSYFNNQTTLILLPGNHMLDKTLSLRGLDHVEILGNTTSTSLACSNGGGFEFSDINCVRIKGLVSIGCGPNKLESLQIFTLKDCIFDGNGARETGLVINNVTNTIVELSGFYGNRGTTTILSHPSVRGVITVLNGIISIGNCVFYGNSAYENGFGGAVYTEQSTIEVTNSTFSSNIASTAGGVFAITDSNITIQNSVVSSNTLAIYGGAIFATSADQSVTSITLINSTFAYNRAALGGVIVADKNVCISIKSSKFLSNVADSSGSVIIAQNHCYLKITDSIFNNNTGLVINNDMNTTIESTGFYRIRRTANPLPNQPSVRGVIAVVYGTISIANCDFYGNSAYENGLPGFGGAVYTEQSTIEVTNSTFSSNVASNGGGVFAIIDSNITIRNSVVSSNTLAMNVGYGGAIFATSATERSVSSITLNNSTFAYNRAAFGGVIVADTNVWISIKSSKFLSNQADSSGGVIIVRNHCYLEITESIFDKNLARGNIGVIRAVNSTTISIRHSLFQNNGAEHAGGVIGVYSESNITLEGSVFASNIAVVGSGGVIIAYRAKVFVKNCSVIGNLAQEGGFADIAASSMEAIDCEFINNTALDTGGVVNGALIGSNITLDICLFAYNTAPRGGVVYAEDSTFMIQNCVMAYNTADGFGAAIQCKGNNPLQFAPSSINLFNVTFTHNSVVSTGAGVVMVSTCNLNTEGYVHFYNNTGSKGVVFVLQGNATFHGQISFVDNFGSISIIDSEAVFYGDTLLESNTPHISEYNLDRYSEGGAISVFKGELQLRGNTTIKTNLAENGGAIQAIQSTVYISGVANILDNTATVSGGGIYAYQSKISFSKLVHIGNNTAAIYGGGIHAVSSTIQFSNGTHTLQENRAKQGGGMSFDLNSKVTLIKYIPERYNCSLDRRFRQPCFEDELEWLLLEFVDNSAEYGGAMFVNDGANSDTCAGSKTQSYSPTNECFFQTQSLYWSTITPLLPEKHLNNTIFQNNSATVRGDNIYGGLIDRCIASPYLEKDNETETTVDYLRYLQTRTSIELSSISSEPVRVCFCQHGSPDCSYTPPTIEVIKGQTITIAAVAVDQVNHTLPSTIHSSLSSQGGGLSEGESKQSITENCTDLRYTVLSPFETEELVLYAEGPCKDIGISDQSVEVKFLPCPIGFTLTTSKTHCDCDPSLKPYVTNCSISTSSLWRNGEFWIQYVANQSGYLIYPHCPFDYCFPPTQTVTINLNVENGTDSQCVFNHSGMLCGKCKSGLSLSLGSTHCRRCSNYWLLLLIPFALAGVLLVAFLLLLNLTVAIGTINGLVFYANVIAANRASLFPSDLSNAVTVFIAWINLDFGFETCFFDRMDAYVKTWLQFVFPLYVIFLVAAIIVISDYSTRFASLFTRKNPEATLATLILLSYTKLLRTIIAALSFARLDYPDGSHSTVWLLDANVSYLQGKHIPLFIAAIVTALVGLAYTLVLFSWQWLVRYSNTKLFKWTRNTYLNSFMDAYHAPLNGKHRYWTGLLLITRTSLLLVSATNIFGDARVNLLAIVCATVFLFLLQKTQYQGPYRKWPLDMLEFTFIVNLTIFAAASFYCRDNNPSNQVALAYTSISIALLTFVAIIFYHMYTFAFQKSSLLGRIKDKLKRCLFGKRHEDEHIRELLDMAEGNFPNHEHGEVLSDNVSFTVLDVTQYANEAGENSNETHNSFETLSTQEQELRE